MRTRRMPPATALLMAALCHIPVYGQPEVRPGERPAYTGPVVVVRRNGEPMRDDRRVGDVRIHQPGSATVVRRNGRTGATSAPANSLFGDEPLWYTRNLQSADLRIAEASADWVQAQADLVRTRRRSLSAIYSPFLYLSVPYVMTPTFASGSPIGDAGMTRHEAQETPAQASDEPGRPSDRAVDTSQPRANQDAAARPGDEPYTGPTIVVHRDGRRQAEGPSEPRLHLPDGRVVVMSRGGTSPGRIEVPANTVFDGPPNWYIRGLQSADVRLANATADWVEAQADRAQRRLNRRRW